MINNEMSDKVILNELGLRISSYRLSKNMTQSALAVEAGISRPTVQRAENGLSVQLSKLMRILRALNLIGNIESLIPGIAVSPLQQLKMKGKTRRRASSLREDEKKSNWSWGDKE